MHCEQMGKGIRNASPLKAIEQMKDGLGGGDGKPWTLFDSKSSSLSMEGCWKEPQME